MQPPNVNLYPGSTDKANVKRLQDYLVSLGLLDKSYITGANAAGYGTYGPRTTAAVAALQKKFNVDTSGGGVGNFGPITSKVVSQQAGTQAPNAKYNPFGMGTVDVNASQNTPGSTDPANTDGRYNFGGGEYLTQEEMDALVKANFDEQTPFYDAQQKYELGGFGNTEDSILNSYDLTRRDYEARAQEDLDTLNDNEGKSGTWASSERMKRRKSLQDKYNRTFESAYNQNVDNLYKNRLDRAYNYGDTNVGTNVPLQRYGTTFGDTTATTNNLGGGGMYNPFGFQGRKNVERKQNAKLGAINNLETFTYKNNFIK